MPLGQTQSLGATTYLQNGDYIGSGFIIQGVGATLPSVAGVLTGVTNEIHIVSGALAITGITIPVLISGVPFDGCQITLIPTGAFTTTNATNIAIASTAVVGKALTMTYLASTSKWYPSY